MHAECCCEFIGKSNVCLLDTACSVVNTATFALSVQFKDTFLKAGLIRFKLSIS